MALRVVRTNKAVDLKKVLLQGSEKRVLPAFNYKAVPKFLEDITHVWNVSRRRIDARRVREPIYEDSFTEIFNAIMEYNYPSMGHAFVDVDETISSTEWRRYRYSKNNLYKAGWWLYPLAIFGPFGALTWIARAVKPSHVPLSLVGVDANVEEKLIQYHKNSQDEAKLKYGPLVSRAISQFAWEHYTLTIPDELLPHYRNLFNVHREHAQPSAQMMVELSDWFEPYGNPSSGVMPLNWEPTVWKNLYAFWDLAPIAAPTVMHSKFPFDDRPKSMQQALFNFFEDLMQEDQLIRREGGPSNLEPSELLAACLERNLTRVEEQLSRSELEHRLTEWLLMTEHRTNPYLLTAYAANFHWDFQLNLTNTYLHESEWWTETDSLLPKQEFDKDPMEPLGVYFQLTDGQKDCLEYYRDQWLRTNDAEQKERMTVVLADLVAGGAPHWVRNLSADVQRDIISAVAHNFLRNGNSEYARALLSQAQLPNTAATTRGHAANVAVGNPTQAATLYGQYHSSGGGSTNARALAQESSQVSVETWTLPATAEFELREFIDPKTVKVSCAADAYVPDYELLEYDFGEVCDYQSHAPLETSNADLYPQLPQFKALRNGRKPGPSVLRTYNISPRDEELAVIPNRDIRTTAGPFEEVYSGFGSYVR